MKLAEVMDRDLSAITRDTLLGEAIEILCRHRLSGIPVVDSVNKVVGFISEKDIVKAALPGYFEYLRDSSFIPDFGQFHNRLHKISREPVEKYMISDVATFSEDDSDFSVAMVLIQKNFKRAPVVQNGELVGIVNRADLLERIMSSDEEKKHHSE
ncbi:MAG: CBS domain-containing protein [Synergistales bacterium]|nr:CBS domain-containing protein [Synergistales bacterium]